MKKEKIKKGLPLVFILVLLGVNLFLADRQGVYYDYFRGFSAAAVVIIIAERNKKKRKNGRI